MLDLLRRFVGEARCRVYDWRHNVDTCGDANLDGLTISGTNAGHGVFYHPSHPKFLSQVLSSLGIDYEKFTFVDLGSGKGRVLLVASEFPFREIVGVEFARELHEIASVNVKNYRSSSQKCKNINCVHQDAVDFKFPLTPLVLYLSNPFRPAVLIPVLQNLQASLDAHPRDALLLYVAPYHAELIERETMMKCVATSSYHNTYQIPASPSTSPVRS
jgi:SAM-dependent methyltransferase